MKLILLYCKKMIFRYKWLFLRSVLLSLVITAMNIFIPYGMRIYIDHIHAFSQLWIIVAGLAVFMVCMLLTTVVEIRWYIMLDQFGGNCIRDLTIELEEILAHTSLARIDEVRTERIRHILYADVLDVFRVIGHHIPSLLGNMITLAACFVLAMCYNLQMAVFLFFTSVAGILISLGSRNMIARKAGETNQRLKEHHALCSQYADSILLAQTNPVLGYFQDKTADRITGFIKSSQKEDHVTVFWSRAVSHYNTLVTIALSALLLFLTTEGTAVELVFFTMLAGIISSQSQSAELLFQQIMKAEVSFQNVDRIRNLPVRSGKEELGTVKEICFDHVSFAYPDSEEILKDVSCRFTAGEMIRLTGANGSGKSTFLRLLLGLYPPKNGRVLLNGKETGILRQESIMRQIVYISQDEIFLNETLKHYLEIVSGVSLDEEKMKRWPEEFALGDIERVIENEGLSLSAGQRKKMLILKLLLRENEASVIILDEIEAGLDQKARRMLEQYLKEYKETDGKIFLMIEHDVKDELRFDQVVEF